MSIGSSDRQPISIEYSKSNGKYLYVWRAVRWSPLPLPLAASYKYTLERSFLPASRDFIFLPRLLEYKPKEIFLLPFFAFFFYFPFFLSFRTAFLAYALTFHALWQVQDLFFRPVSKERCKQLSTHLFWYATLPLWYVETLLSIAKHLFNELPGNIFSSNNMNASLDER